MTSTAVATVNDEPKGIRGLLQHERAKQQIMPFLRGADYEAVVQETLLAVAANPALKKCDPASIISAVATAVRWQGVIGEDVHLVPFGDKVTPMKDYKFKAKQIVATGAARQVYAVAVYKNEPFTFTQGTQPTIQHQVLLDEKARGPMVGAYAVAMIRAGQFQIRSMTVGEIDRIRQDKSKSWKGGALPEWYTLKTVIHQLAKLLPTNAKLARLIEEDEAIEEGTLDAGPVSIVAAPEQPRITRPGSTS
jgi:phage RecT family recombinase